MENSAVMNGRDTQEVKTPLEHAFGQVNLQSQDLTSPTARGFTHGEQPITPPSTRAPPLRSTFAPPPPAQTPSQGSGEHISPLSPTSPLMPVTPDTPLYGKASRISKDHLRLLRENRDADNLQPLDFGFGIQSSVRRVPRLPVQIQAELEQEVARGRKIDGRYLLIHGLPLDSSPAEIKELFTGLAELKAIIIKFLSSHGFLFLVFFDPRQALAVQNTLRDHPIEFSASPSGGTMLVADEATRKSVEDIVGAEPSMEKVWHDADPEVLLQVIPSSLGLASVTPNDLHNALDRIGDVRCFRALDLNGQTYLVEFFDTRRASEAVVLLDGSTIADCRISASSAADSIAYGAQRPPRLGPAPLTLFESSKGSPVPVRGSRPFRQSLPPTPENRTLDLPPQYESPTTRKGPGTYVPPRLRSKPAFASVDTAKSKAILPSYSLQHDIEIVRDKHLRPHTSLILGSACNQSVKNSASHVAATPTVERAISRAMSSPNLVAKAKEHIWKDTTPESQRIPEPNIVDVAKVRTGLDSRTTVMIKDVPNKLSRQQLVEIIREVVPGDFDFIYLRFDFKNRCNVGYAFVNFCSTTALYKFIEAKVGRKWNLFSSEKVLQVSYADIQGKEALIAKFRNSSVMDVNEEWRPQVFRSNGPLKGLVEDFPESNDPPTRYRSAAIRAMDDFYEPAEVGPKHSARNATKAKW